jgi:hypothetical protein
MREVWAWGFRVMFQACDLRSNLSVGLTVAYQGATPQAWRGIMVTLIVGTVSIGWHYGNR